MLFDYNNYFVLHQEWGPRSGLYVKNKTGSTIKIIDSIKDETFGLKNDETTTRPFVAGYSLRVIAGKSRTGISVGWGAYTITYSENGKALVLSKKQPEPSAGV